MIAIDYPEGNAMKKGKTPPKPKEATPPAANPFEDAKFQATVKQILGVSPTVKHHGEQAK